jgi:hypothetical protein
MFKRLDLELGKIVSSVHGEKRCKTVCWEKLELGLNNIGTNDHIDLTINIVLSDKSFAMP